MKQSNTPVEQASWPDPSLTADQYKESYLTALYRMSVLLNSGIERSPITSKYLLLTDQDLSAQFPKEKTLADTVRFRVIQGDPNESLREKAEDHFYGQFSFRELQPHNSETRPSQLTKRLRVTHIATDTFMSWSYRMLTKPDGVESILRSAEFETPMWFAFHCATNYALKNFWHNFVHERLQGISHHNYHVFAGDARFETDFEADNLANILLLLSYGIEVRARGKTTPQIAARTRTLFSRNACNRVFEERAKQRITVSTPLPDRDKWSEYEWGIRRRLANAIGQKLAEEGMAAASLGVYFGGRLDIGRNGFFRSKDSTVCVRINGFWIDTGIAPYVPSDVFNRDTFGIPLTDKRNEEWRAFRSKRRLEIVTSASTLYRKHLLGSAQLRDMSDAGIARLRERLCID